MGETDAGGGPVKRAAVSVGAACLATLLASTTSQAQGAGRRINAPYFATTASYPEAAVAWYGRVDALQNYTDVRVAYTATELWITLSIFDQWLWEDDSATRTPDSLEEWDAATLLLDTGTSAPTAPTGTSYRFVGELSWWRPRTDYQAAYVGSGGGWVLSPSTVFTTETGWRGNAPNDNIADKGWTITYHIPFTSLGLTGPPAAGTVWHLGFIGHDKDSAGTPAVSDTWWPETLIRDQPLTWGQLGFGLRSYPAVTPPPSALTYTIRHGLNGIVATDAMVGGGSTCGTSTDYFNTWGSLNYAGSTTLVVQNESDVSDWPCFSKAYFNFPLGSLPPGKVVVSATLTVYQFGGSDPTQAQHSLIQVVTVDPGWNESTITWNTAPMALENVSQSWVDVIPAQLPWPGAARTWDVSWAVAQAYGGHLATLGLALYEADSAYHSGKYFTSADTGDWNAVGRPTLQIVLADASALTPSAPTGLHLQ
jgi:hypothetical protein